MSRHFFPSLSFRNVGLVVAASLIFISPIQAQQTLTSPGAAKLPSALDYPMSPAAQSKLSLLPLPTPGVPANSLRVTGPQPSE